jgi:hypothetical protein
MRIRHYFRSLLVVSLYGDQHRIYERMSQINSMVGRNAHQKLTTVKVFDYTKILLKTILDAQANQHLHSDDWQRTIYIDMLGVKTTEFKIKDAKKEAPVKSGRKAAQDYFKWYDNPKSSPANRI